MFFQFQIFLYSLVYFLALELFFSDSFGEWVDSFSEKWLLFAVLVFVFLLIYLYQVAKRVSRRAIMTPIPVILAVSVMSLLYFVQSAKQQQLLILLGAGAYYFLHIALYRLRTCEKDKTARGIMAAGSVSTIFLFYATSFGIYLNFAISLWVLMLIFMVITALVSLQYLWLISENKKKALNYSLVLGFAMAEIVWILNFWPFGYLTTGVISLIFYYVFWDLASRHFLDELSKRRVIVNVLVCGSLMALVLSSTRWLPVV